MAGAARASSTARLIAASIVRAAYEDTAPRPDADAVLWSRRLLRATFTGRALLSSVDSAVGRFVWRQIERAIAPGLVQHFQRRKAWIEERVRAARGDGYTQLVVLGAGFDTLGLRLASSKDPMNVVELDHPATQSLKRGVFESFDAPVTLVPADLANEASFDAAMRAGAMDLTRSTVLIVEGLLMYLGPDAVEQLLRASARIKTPRLLLIATFMERMGDEPARFRRSSALADLWLRQRGEPFRWGASRGEAESLLNRCGFDVLEMVDERTLAERWPGEALEGEVLVLAARR